MASDSPTSVAPHASSLGPPWAPGFAPELRCCGSLEGFLMHRKKPWLLQNSVSRDGSFLELCAPCPRLQALDALLGLLPRL